ncbi:hypothetical protein NKR23_g4837 [Pleurostoma richardsiae]|uniref:Uncharacterized protein n=1 Tax=Pleurostoma richardsiae TaxID=41990 RepID=A0AA38VRM6_9PEZI|nr:hypothetical protein NKR23_g4837 [Pleurostoma richardsiae]
MAAAVAVAHVNGLPGSSSRPDSPQSVNSSTKRKRDASDDGSADVNGAEDEKPPTNGNHITRDEKALIRNYFDVLTSYDTDPPILKRPIREASAADEPQAKRQKSDDNAKPASITDKMMQDGYQLMDELVLDIREAVKAQVDELQSSVSEEPSPSKDEAVAKIVKFKEKAQELFRREISYPKANPEPPKVALGTSQDPNASGSVVLTVYGNAPQAKHLFSSLQKKVSTPDDPDGIARPFPENALPNGISITRLIPPLSTEKSSRSLTLGELFPAPRNLPPLQPPKAPKSTTKSNVLGFYHPELAEKSKYRSGSYFSQPISAGHWLDYSNATPSSQIKTKQRERAQSLAGHKPSSSELEMSEMESLFRGAFSSFAPSRDDSAAMVSSGQVSRMWWQRFGQRSFQRMIDAEALEDSAEEAQAAEIDEPMEVDEDLVKDAIENWDESLVDPSLEEALGKKKPDDEDDVEGILQEVSDLIETLSSYQRNRNLALPTSQNRYSADPVNGDMLANGNLAQQPSEEEMVTYQALKAQLALIVKSLPPYAVARLNSDKLEELNISTKIEIRTDEYKGVMEEDEPAAKARAMAAAATPRPVPHRTPSVSNAVPYPGQYARQYPVQGQTPVPVANYYPQTPARPQGPPSYQRPMQQPMPQAQQRSPAPQAYRAGPNGYPVYAQQLAKAQTPYGHSNVGSYQGTPNQQRLAQHPGYPNVAPPGTPGQQRYTPGYPAGYGPPPGMQPPHHPQQPVYPGYANGAMPQRTMSPQVVGQHPGYASQSPQPPPQQLSRAPSYGTPGQAPMQPNAPRYVQYANSPAAPSQVQPGPGPSGYHSVLPDSQHQRIVDQTKARFAAHERSMGFGDKLQQGNFPPVAGLGGIGLGGHVDMSKLAAARANMPGGVAHTSPSPRLPNAGAASGQSPAVNGGSQPPAASPASIPASSVSPAPAPGFQPKPPS